MKQFLLVVIAALMTTACGKDTFQSKPQLFLKSVSSTTIPVGSDLQIFLRLTDKEGDFKDTVWISKITTRCPSSNWADSNKYFIPVDVPKTPNFDGEIKVTLDYYLDFLQPRCTRPDTAVFSFWMKDDKGNQSDTVKTPSIIILR
jgi:hypothetical protein